MRMHVAGLCVLGCALSASQFAAAVHAQLGEVMKKAQKVKKATDIYGQWTPGQEMAIGQASAAKLVNIFGLYENPEMTQYVNLVGNTVARQATRQVTYHFAILDSEIVTAVSLPSGYVFITRGALANIKNESELAGTLAHEVAHIDRRHLEKEIRAQKTGQFAKEEAAARVPTGAVLVNMAGEVVTRLLTLQFSRDKENEADKLGMDFAAKAGYDALGLRNFLQFLAQVPSDERSKRKLGLWGSTHPAFSARVNSLTALATNYPPNGQQLGERYNWYVNPVAFARPLTPGAPGAAPAGGMAEMAAGGGKGPELDGIVSKGVVVLTGGTLVEGSRVKVRLVQ